MKRIFSLLIGIAISLATLQAQETKVSILSYNVRNCIGLDNVRDYQRIANAIVKQSPDVVALQELDSVTARNGKVFALGELKKLTKMQGIYASAIPYDGGSYGIGILSKEKPLNYRIVPMPGREEKRTMIVAEFKDYVFCATHQSLTPEDQLLSIPIIEAALKGIKKPIFLAGDMNSTPNDTPQKELNKSFITLNDIKGYTFPANKPSECIDYIYGYQKNNHQFQVQQFQVVEEEIASDHRPIQVNVVIR